MPDDYYVSQYSGEEWDSLLAGAAGGVRYDKAQSLTAAQQAQARGNIGAAPDGFGLGANGYPYRYTVITGDMVDGLSRSGLYWFNDHDNPLFADGWNSGTIGLLLHLQSDGHNANSARQIYFPNYPVNGVGHNCRVEREKTTDDVWLPWEFVNPPLILGMEYRTTERYQGKSVYAKAVNLGALPNNGSKRVDFSETACNVISVSGNAVTSGDNYLIPSSTINIVKMYANSTTIFIVTENDQSNATATVILKYTKTTG